MFFFAGHFENTESGQLAGRMSWTASLSMLELFLGKNVFGAMTTYRPRRSFQGSSFLVKGNGQAV